MDNQLQTLFLGGSKITADGDYSHEIKRRLLLERKVMTNLDSAIQPSHPLSSPSPPILNLSQHQGLFTQVQSLGWEDPLETGMTAHSSILARRIPWTEEPGRLQSMGSLRVGHD